MNLPLISQGQDFLQEQGDLFIHDSQSWRCLFGLPHNTLTTITLSCVTLRCTRVALEHVVVTIIFIID